MADEIVIDEARKKIQQRIDASIASYKSKVYIDYMTEDFTLKLRGGETLNREQLRQNQQRDQGEIISVGDETKIVIEAISLEGSEANVYTKQHFVRTVHGRDGKPHEVITNITHRELWVSTEEGWLQREIEELEQGPIYVDGELYDIN